MPRTNPKTVDEIKRLLNQFEEALQQSNYTAGAQSDFLGGAVRFFRWIEDSRRILEPGQWPKDDGAWRD